MKNGKGVVKSCTVIIGMCRLGPDRALSPHGTESTQLQWQVAELERLQKVTRRSPPPRQHGLNGWSNSLALQAVIMFQRTVRVATRSVQ